MTGRGVSRESKLRFAAFAGVLLIASGLIVNLFDEARGATFDFVSPATSVSAPTTFTVELKMDTTERLPIQSVHGILERQDPTRDGQTGLAGKAGAALQTRASCPFQPVNGVLSCSATGTTPVLTQSGPKPGGISNIALGGFFDRNNGYTVAYTSVFATGVTDGFTNTPYGYHAPGSGPSTLPGVGYGYGYDTDGGTSCPACITEGYGYTDDGGLVIRLTVTVAPATLDRGTHYLTVVLITGSATIGDVSTTFTEFTVSKPGGGGGGGPTTPPDTFDGQPVPAPEGALSKWRAVITGEKDKILKINFGDDEFPGMEFKPAVDLTNAVLEVTFWPMSFNPPGTGAPPEGLTLGRFVTVELDVANGDTHEMRLLLAIKPENAGRVDSAFFMKFIDPSWKSQGAVSVALQDGRLKGNTPWAPCCSDFALSYDEVNPTVSLAIPSGELTGVESITATASDNVEVTKVDFFVDGTMVHTDSEAPFTYSFDTSKFSDGDHIVRAVAYDPVNNMGEDSGTASVAEGAGGADGGDGGAGGGDGGFPWGTVLLVILILAIIGAAGYYFYQQQQNK